MKEVAPLPIEKSGPLASRSSPPRPLFRWAASLAGKVGQVLWNPIARKSALSLLDQMVTSGTNFVTSVVIGRLSAGDDPRQELGTYALALSLVLFVRGVQTEGISAPYNVFHHRRQGRDLAAYTGSKLVLHLLISALFSLVLLVYDTFFSAWCGPEGLDRAIWVLVGAAPLFLLREYFRQLCFAHLRLRASLLLDLSVAALQIAGLLLLASWHALNAATAFAVIGGACALACAGWLVLGRQPVWFVPANFLRDWRHDWAFARWSLGSFLVGSTTPMLMPWLVYHTHGEVANGILAACFQTVNVAGMYVMGVTNFLLPQAAAALNKDGPEGLRAVLAQTALLLIITLGPFCLLLLAAADLPTVLLYGPQYTGTGPVLALLSTTILVNSLGIIAGNGLYALQRPGANLAADLCCLTTTVALALCLVSPLGVTGAAAASLVGTTLGVAVRSITLARLIRRNPVEEPGPAKVDLPVPAGGNLEPNSEGQ